MTEARADLLLLNSGGQITGQEVKKPVRVEDASYDLAKVIFLE
ncbi:hypothetical protein [Oscillatoria sp. FACHB-1406]|nr:hypothetical protein [Oscillatoria sp. FACHB-1406]